jgi:hypothetical protein
MHPGRLAATLGAAIALLLAAAVPARAAVTIGQAPPAPDELGDCAPGSLVQVSNAEGPGYAVPSPGGVVTRWRTSATGDVSLLLWQEVGAGWRLVAADPRAPSGGGGVAEFAVRIPVSGGEHLGIGSAKEVLDCEVFTKMGKDEIGVAGEAAVGSMPALFLKGGWRLNVAADVEPDADHDGFGDETQDGCPTDARRQGPCPDVDPPETAITGHPKKTASTRRVRFRFSADEPGSTFECKLDKRPFRPCLSPFSRKVAPGPHVFRVRSRDVAGNLDASPARFAWRVARR